MATSYKTILIPVDFSINTKVAVAKALDVLDADGARIYLLHVKSGIFGAGEKAAAQKMEEWKCAIESLMPQVSVQCSIHQATSVQRCIQRAAANVSADLIVLGKSSAQTWVRFPGSVLPMKLANKTKVPVLTAKPGALHSKIKTVVVPISSEAQDSKIKTIEQLCRRGKPNIHLLAFDQGVQQQQSSAPALLQVYQWVKKFAHCPVEYALLQGENKAKEIMDYAEKVSADMILVYPEQETRLDFWNRHIPDVLPYASKMQVLAVQPAYS